MLVILLPYVTCVQICYPIPPFLNLGLLGIHWKVKGHIFHTGDPSGWVQASGVLVSGLLKIKKNSNNKSTLFDAYSYFV